jgi:hypothetical protein
VISVDHAVPFRLDLLEDTVVELREKPLLQGETVLPVLDRTGGRKFGIKLRLVSHSQLRLTL